MCPQFSTPLAPGAASQGPPPTGKDRIVRAGLAQFVGAERRPMNRVPHPDAAIRPVDLDVVTSPSSAMSVGQIRSERHGRAAPVPPDAPAQAIADMTIEGIGTRDHRRARWPRRQPVPGGFGAGKEYAMTEVAEATVLPEGSGPRRSATQPMRQPSEDAGCGEAAVVRFA